MTRWLDRQESIHQFTQYLKWFKGGNYAPSSSNLHPSEQLLVEDEGTLVATPVNHPKTSPLPPKPTLRLSYSLQPYRLYFYINTGIIPTIHDQCIWDKPHQPKNSVNQGVSRGAGAR